MKKLAVLATMLLIPFSLRSQTANNPTPDAPMQSSNPSLPQLELRGSTSTLFARLIRQSGLSGGIATSDGGCAHIPEQTVSITSGTTFDKAVSQIANVKAGLGLQREDGVANLFPSGLVPPLLAIRVNFAWDDASPAREVVDRLRQLPEIVQEATRLGLQEAPIEGGSTSLCIRNCVESSRPASVLETVTKVPLLTVLNRIVQAHKGAVWNYEEHQCEGTRVFSLTVTSE